MTPPDTAYAAELHGFAWLDDLAAVGDIAARQAAQTWLWDWIDRFGKGRGPGWTPDLTGRRLIRWINHAIFVLRGQESEQSRAFYRSLEQQTLFLSRRWQGAAPGLPRFEALTGLIYAGLSLEGQEALADPAVKALARECDSQIDAQGGLPTRNPEELLEVFTLLTWAAAALRDAGRGTPTRRILRRSSGSRPPCAPCATRMAGWPGFTAAGAASKGGWITRWPPAASRRGQPDGLSMGYARLSAGRTSVDHRRQLPRRRARPLTTPMPRRSRSN